LPGLIEIAARFDPEEWRKLVAGYRRASIEVK
jgi:hypothetical protein